MTLNTILKTLSVGEFAYCETTVEEYKTVMRRCYHPRLDGTFITKGFTAIGDIGEIQVLVRIERTG